MKLHKTIPMSFENQDYEIKVLYNEKTVNVVAFRDNHPATGLRHQLQIPKGCDVAGVLERGIVEEMVGMARDDIAEGRWVRASQAIQANMA